MVRDTIEKTRGSASPSGLDADGWSRIFLSGNFGSSEDLRKAIADMTKPLCQDNTVKHLEAFIACRLIPLGKQPGVRRSFETCYGKNSYETFENIRSKAHWIFTTLHRTSFRQ